MIIRTEAPPKANAIKASFPVSSNVFFTLELPEDDGVAVKTKSSFSYLGKFGEEESLSPVSGSGSVGSVGSSGSVGCPSVGGVPPATPGAVA